MNEDYGRWLDFGQGATRIFCNTLRVLPTDFAIPAWLGLNLGPGPALLANALNVDVATITDGKSELALGELAVADDLHLCLRQDLRVRGRLEGLVFPWIHAEHLIEHLTPGEGLALLRSLRQSLAPGGTLRLSTPDLTKYMRAYGRLDAGFFARHQTAMCNLGAPSMPERPAWMVNQIFHFWQHQYIYDAADLTKQLSDAGFAADCIAVRGPRESRHPELAGTGLAERTAESLYIEAWV